MDPHAGVERSSTPEDTGAGHLRGGVLHPLTATECYERAGSNDPEAALRTLLGMFNELAVQHNALRAQVARTTDSALADRGECIGLGVEAPGLQYAQLSSSPPSSQSSRFRLLKRRSVRAIRESVSVSHLRGSSRHSPTGSASANTSPEMQSLALPVSSLGSRPSADMMHNTLAARDSDVPSTSAVRRDAPALAAALGPAHDPGRATSPPITVQNEQEAARVQVPGTPPIRQRLVGGAPARKMPDSPQQRGPKSPVRSASLRSTSSSYAYLSSPQTSLTSPPVDEPRTPLVSTQGSALHATGVPGAVPVIAFRIQVQMAKDASFPDTAPTSYTVEKTWSDLNMLHARLAMHAELHGELPPPRVPPAALFEPPFTPERLRQRNASVDAFLATVLRTVPASDDTVAQFLRGVPVHDAPPPTHEVFEQGVLQGLLLARSPDTAGWHLYRCRLYGRVLVLQYAVHPPELTEDGATVIELQGARLARLPGDTPGDTTLHVLEQSRTNRGERVAFTRHVLAAESEELLDHWTEALARITASLNPTHELETVAEEPRGARHRREHSQTVPRSETAELLPAPGPPVAYPDRSASTSPVTGMRHHHSTPRLRGTHLRPETSPTTSPNVGAQTGERRRFWQGLLGFSPGPNDGTARREPVFGVPLAASLHTAALPAGPPGLSPVPAVVRRCVDLLEHNGQGLREEGIYRMSGSASATRALYERFATRGDVDLVAENEAARTTGTPAIDMHVAAGLLKTFFRELPENVLTSALVPEFLDALEILDRAERTERVAALVSQLPAENYALMRLLCSHMNKVASCAEANKMSLQNIGIVLSPTLAIPTGLLFVFLQEFDTLFSLDAHGEASPHIHRPRTDPVRELAL